MRKHALGAATLPESQERQVQGDTHQRGSAAKEVADCREACV